MRIRIFFSLLLLMLFISFLGGAVLLTTYAVDENPIAGMKIELTTEDIARARLIIQKYDPRNLREREISRPALNNREVNILLNYTLDHLRRSNPVFSGIGRIASEVTILTEAAEVLFTIPLPETPFGAFLNVRLFFTETNEKPLIRQISIGEIPFRGRWMKPVLYLGGKLIQHLGVTKELALILGVVKTVLFRPNELTLVYEWRSEVAQKLTEKGRSLLVSDQDRERLVAYYKQITATASSIKTKEAPLIYFTKPVFELAHKRSGANGEPRAENRAAILALTLFVNQRPIAPLIGNYTGKPLPNPKAVITLLRGRTDLPKHFLISATMTVIADSGLSDLIGLFKEIDDSMRGSGFSYVDLLADRAGVRFAELGMAGDREALWVQQTIARSVLESDFMPDVAGLKEGLMQKKFKQRYRDLDSVAFRVEKEEIERRIDNCPLFKIK